MRRGIALFIRKHLTHRIFKEFASATYDIVWIRYEHKLATNMPQETKIICFFYAPGENHPENIRSGFYDELTAGCAKFPENTKIYMVGDSNARLGAYFRDVAINGKYISNKNRSLILGFLDYTGMCYINNIFEPGVPTYEIAGKKRSFIDVCLSNDISTIRSFKILPNV